MRYTERVVAAVDAHAAEIEELSRRLWERPELALEEHFAAKLLADYLRGQSFSVTENVAGMETAFSATWGSGKPVIAFLGEYDALPDMSQEMSCRRKQIVNGGPGHACGHNLLGPAMVGAAVAVKELLEAEKLPGTVRFYGCPAEEIMFGKIMMDKQHVFDDCDICFCWHPMTVNCAANYSYTAMTSVKFRFKGITSHAAEAPEQGRSALDAVELMNVGANYLREHMDTRARIHYVITNGGGKPNVVPPDAESWYYVRAPFRPMVDELVARLIKIQQGAALMTETEPEYEIVSGCTNTQLNLRLNTLLYESLCRVPAPQWDEADYQLASDLLETLPENAITNTLNSFGALELRGEKLHCGVLPLKDTPTFLAGSTDVSNVSASVPTGQVFTCCVPVGTPGHTWQTAVSAGSSIGLKGMRYAEYAVADTAMILFTDPGERDAVREDFEKAKNS